MKNFKKVNFVTKAAAIAAIYVVFTLLANTLGLANHAIQVRISEALTIMPLFTKAAIPGLYIGCLISNIITGCAPWDILFGSLATLIGAIITYKMRGMKQKWMGCIPPIVANTIIVPFILAYVYQAEGSILFFMVTVGIGEIISCGILGNLLRIALKPYKKYFE